MMISASNAAPFTTGNLIVSRTGDGASLLGSSATRVALVEISSNGVAAGNVVSLPTQTLANSGGLTDSGTATSNGHLNLSADGRYLVLAGYDAPLGTVSVIGTTALAVNRNLARIDGTGAVTVMARLADSFSADNARAVSTDTGTVFYVSGNPGLRYVDASASVPTASVEVLALGSVRDTVIFTDATGAKFLLINTAGTALSFFGTMPTMTSTATSLGVTLNDAHAFVLLDRSATVGASGLGGLDTLYVADANGTKGAATAVLRKFEWSGSAWAAAGTATSSVASSKLFGLTTRVAANGSVQLYATTGIKSNNSLVSISDGSNGGAFGGALSGTLTTLASAGPNYAFRGVAFAPQTDLAVSVSAPASSLAGSNYDYTITASNLGASKAAGVSVSFTLPAGLNYVGAHGSSFTASQNSGVVTFTGGSINAGAIVALTVTVFATSAATYTTALGAAVIDPADVITETNESNNASISTAETQVIIAPDLTMTAAFNGLFIMGSSASYTLTVNNVGNAETLGVVTFSASLPTGLTATALSGSGWAITQATGGSVSATRSDVLTAAQSYPALTLSVDVASSTQASLTVTTAASGGGESNTANSNLDVVTPIEVAGPGSIALSTGLYSVFEEAGSVNLTLQRTGGRQGSVRVTITSTNGSAVSSADYTAVNQVITLADREVTKNVVIAIAADSVSEPNERFTVSLSNPQDGVVLGTQLAAQVLIAEADAKSPVLKVSSPTINQLVNEGAFSVTGSVTDNKGIASVQVKLNNGVFVNAPMTQAANELSATFTLPISPVPGANTITVKALDWRGNAANEISLSIFYRVLRTFTQLTVTDISSSRTAQVQLGASYILGAQARPGYVFKNWSSPQLILTDVEATRPYLNFTMVEGLTVTTTFIPTPFVSQITGDFSGLIRAAGITLPSHETDGFITMKVTLSGGFSGSIKIAGLAIPFVGSLDYLGRARFSNDYATTLLLPRQDRAGYVLSLNLDMAPSGTQSMTGTLAKQTRTGSEPMSEVQLNRSFYDGKTPASSLSPEFYTFVLPAQTQALSNSNYPRGDGIGGIKLSKTGVLRITGILADGTAITASTPLGKAQTAPLFVPLERGAGSLNGWLTVDNTRPDTDMSGADLRWFKPQTTGHYYPFGWPEGVTLNMLAARYSVPVGESVLPDLSEVAGANALLEFDRGGLPDPVKKELKVSVSNLITKLPVNDVSYILKLIPATGRFSGSLAAIKEQVAAAFNGAILQKGENRRGFGHFLTAAPRVISGTGKSGVVSLKTKFNPRQTLVISEFMAANTRTLADEDNAFSDWIEIYNPSTASVDLTNWCLTDDASNLIKWRFPAVTLGARQFLLVWASSKDRRVPGQPLHTNFSLSSGGEFLALVRPDGVTVEHEFSPMYPAQANDESYGIDFTGRSLLSQGAAVKYRVPANDSLGSTWVSRSFKDSAWSTGKTGLGFGVGVPGFTVRQVAARVTFGEVRSIATCEALLALPKGHVMILSEATVIAPWINYLGDGSDGRYANNTALPNGTAEPYAIKATGIITIPSAGNYVFGLNSDDGGRIKIDGIAVMTDDTNHGPVDNLSAPVNLTAGAHSVEIIMWEGGGGDCVEFFAKAGTDTTWNADFKLVGSLGGLSIVTPPLGSTSISSQFIGTDLQTHMRGNNASCFIRLPFTATAISGYTGLTLRMRYNDGFVAYLNGTEVVRRNAPASPVFDSTATGTHGALDTLTEEVFDLTAQISLLATGSNVLAIHGLNDTKDDSSFLMLPELNASAGLAGNVAFFRPANDVINATPGTLNGVPLFKGRVQPLVFSQKHGIYSQALFLALTSPTPGTIIRYTLDGSTPTATKGTVYSEPLRIAATSIIRAIGYRAGFEPTDVQTQSYFFLDDVIRQAATGSRPAVGWPAGMVNGQVADYGMDPQIVNSTNSQIGGVYQVKSALQALPTISIVSDLPNLFDAGTGIWVNPYNRGEAWERPCSIELIGDKEATSGGFGVNAGLRLRGGFSRSTDNPKHSFRLFFRAQYGASKLNYPLFGDEGAAAFDKIDFRTAQNYSWSFGGDGNNTFMREETTRELQGAMGQPYARGRYYHLYLNGQYWGIYGADERTEAAFAETYIGGKAEDYDTVKGEQDQGYITGTTDGNLDAWNDLRIKARAHAIAPTNENYFAMQGRAADSITLTTNPVLLDSANLIDYMLLTFWTGNLDGCTSAFLGDSRANNWFGSRNRLGTYGGFRFFAHDFEHSFFNVDEDRTGPFSSANPNDVDTYNPMFLHHDLRGNAEYRMLWADRVQKHLFGEGALTTEAIIPRLKARRTLVDSAIIAESARWGDAKRAVPYTRLDWAGAADYLTDQYVPQRTSRVLTQLRDDGLYPSFDAPTLSHKGGRFSSGSELVISGNGGTIYFTTDGSDPRLVGGALNPVAQTYSSSVETTLVVPLTQTWKYLADGTDQGSAWRNAIYDDTAWPSGAGELGYGDGDEATVVPFVDADSVTAGIQKNASTYFRASFDLTSVTDLTAAALSVKYDDAVIIYINGTQVARSPNISSNVSFNTYSSGGAPDENAYFTFNVDPALLIPGANVIAAEVHQADSGSSDISFSASLGVTRTNTPTPLLLTGTGNQKVKVRAQSNGEWSALSEAAFELLQAPDLTLALAPVSVFSAGSSAVYNLTVSNVGTAPTNGNVTVTASLPLGLTAASLSGNGWTVTPGTGATIRATRSSALASMASYPNLVLNVNIAATAPAYVTITAQVSGGGEVNTKNSNASSLTPIASTGDSQFVLGSMNFSGQESAGLATITILRTGNRAGAASVRLTTMDGTAKAPADYNAQNQTLNFTDSEASRTIDIGLANDTRTELHERFTVKLDNVTGAASIGLPSLATVTILENDVKAPLVTLTTPTVGSRLVLAAVILKGSAADDKGLGKVQVALNGAAFSEAIITPSANGLAASYTVSVAAIAGLNTVRIRAVDASGLVSAEVVRQFTFAPLRPLSLAVLPAASGAFTITPASDLALLEVGRSYTLNARAKAGFLFDRWSGPAIDRESETLTFTMTEGLAISANFSVNPYDALNTGSYAGLVQSAPLVVKEHGNHGAVNFALMPAGSFTGRLKLGASTYQITGSLHPNGGARFGKERVATLLLPRKNQQSLVFQMSVNPTTRRISGQVGLQQRNAVSARSVYSAVRAHIPLSGNSALLKHRGLFDMTWAAVPQPGLLITDYPQTAASLVGTMNQAGRFTLVGTLGDGEKFTASASLDEALAAPVFSLIYRTSGSLIVPCVFDDTASLGTMQATDSRWFKPVTNVAPYPFGWTQGITFDLSGAVSP